MSKESGLGDNLYAGGYDLSGDVGAVSAISNRRAEHDVTAINASARERVGGRYDGNIAFNCFFNVASAQEHVALKAPSASDIVVCYERGTTLGDPAAGCIGKQVDYAWERAADGGILGSIDVQSNGYGLEWGVQGTAGLRTDAGPANGDGVDNGASSSTGLAAYLQVTSVTGTSITVKLQESSDDAVGDPYADITGGAFSAATPAGSNTHQRIETALDLAVEQWVRVISTGTFNPATFAVLFSRTPTGS